MPARSLVVAVISGGRCGREAAHEATQTAMVDCSRTVVDVGAHHGPKRPGRDGGVRLVRSRSRRHGAGGGDGAGVVVSVECGGAVHRVQVSESGVELLDHADGADELLLVALGAQPGFGCAALASDWRGARVDRLPPPLAERAFRRWRDIGLGPEDVWLLPVATGESTSRPPASITPARFDALGEIAQLLRARMARFPTPEELAAVVASR